MMSVHDAESGGDFARYQANRYGIPLIDVGGFVIKLAEQPGLLHQILELQKGIHRMYLDQMTLE